MRTLAKSIEVLTISDSYGNMIPLRFKAKDKNEDVIIIKVDNVKSSESEKLFGNIMMLYKCTGLVNDKHREFELKYEINSCKWMLWRM